MIINDETNPIENNDTNANDVLQEKETSDEKREETNSTENNDTNANDVFQEKETSDEKREETNSREKDNYEFGWNKYAEITNGRFAMLGFLAILFIEIMSKKPFLEWSGIFN